MSHTEGKLSVRESGMGGEIINESGTDITEFLNGAITKDDARRLVACWNACDGMLTESLEDSLSETGRPMVALNVGNAALRLDKASLQKERAELLEALRVCADYLPDLIGAWSWKEGEIAGNAKEYDDLVSTEKSTRAILAKYKEKE